MIPNAQSRPQESIGVKEVEERAFLTRFALGAAAVVALALSVAAFLLLCYLPLEPAGLWAQLSMGDRILDHRSLPLSDPILRFAEGMPIVEASWLSQVILATVERSGEGVARGAGIGWLGALFALLRVATAALLFATFRRLTASALKSALGLALVLALAGRASGPWAALSPATFGTLCLALLLAGIVRVEAGEGEPARAGLPAAVLFGLAWVALFALWANLHVSFVLGLAAVAIFTLGRSVEVVRGRALGEGVFRALAADRPFRRWFRLFELAAVATLANPYGVGLWLYVWRLPSAANLRDLPDWRPLSVATAGGWAFALLIGALLWALSTARTGRPMLSSARTLGLAAFGGAVLAASGLLALCAPLLVGFVLPAIVGVVGGNGETRAPARGVHARLSAWARERFGSLADPSWHKSVLAAALLWAAFALSPVGAALLRGEARPPERTLSARVPLALGNYLRAHPPRGVTFVPTSWADWLVREGPKESDRLQPFADTRIERLPGLVWQDYLRIAGGAADWQRVLGRYGVRTAIFDRAAQHGQIQSLRYDDEWRIAYEDDSAFVFERIAPVGAKGGAS